jgi:hypothetical protein
VSEVPARRSNTAAESVAVEVRKSSKKTNGAGKVVTRTASHGAAFSIRFTATSRFDTFPIASLNIYSAPWKS